MKSNYAYGLTGLLIGLTTSSLYHQAGMRENIQQGEMGVEVEQHQQASRCTVSEFQALKAELDTAKLEISKLQQGLLKHNSLEQPINAVVVGAKTTSPTPQDERVQDNINNENLAPPAHFFCLCATVGECGDFCDTKITFKDATNPYNMPGSTWTTARNAMYLLAKDKVTRAKLLHKIPEQHFCFVDGDATMGPGGKEQLIQRLAKETELNKIIAPNYNNKFQTEQYAFMVDAMFNCFSTQSMDLYLPYRSALDASSWWVSQFDLVYRANLVEQFPYKYYTDIPVYNPVHGTYPKGLKYLRKLRSWYFVGFSAGCTPFDVTPTTCKHYQKTIYTISFNETHIYRGL